MQPFSNFFLSKTQVITLTATFVALPSISVQSNNTAMGSASVVQPPTCTSNEAIVQATANSGFNFVKWDDGNTYNPRTLSVMQDMTLTAIFESAAGIDNVEANQLSIYPNPVNYELRIMNYEFGVENYSIIDMTGKVVMQGKLKAPSGGKPSGETTINVSSLSQGVYFIKTGNKTGKFVKE